MLPVYGFERDFAECNLSNSHNIIFCYFDELWPLRLLNSASKHQP